MKQKYTSANTSINSTKLPKAYTTLKKYNTNNMTIIDYGCGRYTGHLKTALPCKSWNGYDLTWNNDTSLLDNYYDIAICSNVLNVIAEDEIVDSIINTLANIATIAVITIYDGNKSNIGKCSKVDCYQRNETIDKYVKRIEKLGHKCKVKYNTIFIGNLLF